MDSLGGENEELRVIVPMMWRGEESRVDIKRRLWKPGLDFDEKTKYVARCTAFKSLHRHLLQ